MTSRTPPQNIPAEQALLGAVLISPRALTTARGLVSDDDWYRPAHEQLWSLIRQLDERGDAVDAVTVAGEILAQGKLAATGGLAYLHTLVEAVPTAANVAYYAEQVAEAATLRRLIYVHENGAQRAYASASGNHPATVAELLENTRVELEHVHRIHVGDGDIDGLLTWAEFFDTHAGNDANWVIPGLIGRLDVWMVLAPPGAGKSTLSRQLAWSLAAGIHPFHPDRTIEAKNSLLVDLENDEGQVADDSLHHYGRINSLGRGTEDRGWIWSRPQGINLSSSDDVALFDEVLRRTKPELVTFGSLTNSAPRKGDWDQLASLIRDSLNRLRTRHTFALWLEHHMPKATDGTGRRQSPFGSQIFESWPSHGRVLIKGDEKNPSSPYRFTSPFRGDRGARDTPAGFTRGGRHAWTPVWDEGELDVLIEAATAK